MRSRTGPIARRRLLTHLPLFLAAAAILLTGACTVPSTSSTDDIQRQTVQRFRKEHVVHWDLTVPRSAQEFGVRPSQDSAIFDRNSREFWTVTFDLPGGRHFTTKKAIAVGVYIPANSLAVVTINVDVRDLAELNTELVAAATSLGIDRQQIAGFLSEQRRYPLTTTNPESSTVFHGPPIGHIVAEVEPRLGVNDNGIAINYNFNWYAPTAAPAARP